MLEPPLRRVVIPLALALSLAPVATASLEPDRYADDAGEAVGNAHPWAAWAYERLPDRPGSGTGGSGSSGPDEGDDASAGPSPDDGSSSRPDDGPLGAARPVVVVVVGTTDGVLDQLGALDPLGFVGDQVKPVREAAESLPALVLPPSQPEVSEPAPAAASATEVGPAATVPMLVAAGTVMAAAAVAALWMAGSSGSIGAGAASGAGGKLASTDLRRLLPFASPLFTRFEKDTVLGHPKREALYALVLQDPGVSLQRLCDATGLSRTAVTHHLRLMELQHLIVSKRMGRSRHYYENGGRFGRDQKDAYAVLHNDRSKAVADFVRQNPGAIQKAICAALSIPASVAHWHLKRLQDSLLVEAVRHGRTVSYFPGVGLKGMAPITEAAPAPAPAPMPTPAPMAVSPLPLSA